MKNMNNHMKIETAKLGERGQVVIPQDFREELKLKSGETIVFIKENSSLMLKPSKDIQSLERLREDLIDIKIVDKFWKDVKSGKVKLTSQTKEEFLKDLESW